MDTTCCFIGHRKIDCTDKLKLSLTNLIEDLIISHNVNTFLFGSKSEFNDLCHIVVTNLKKRYPHIKRISYTCKSEGCVLEKDREHLQKLYDKTIKHKTNLLGVEEEYEYKNKYTAGKSSYVERNFAMIDNSDYCVFYYNENYTLYNRKSGTKLAYGYATQKKKELFNLFKN